jgi:flagellar basal-body rod protein FlgB
MQPLQLFDMAFRRNEWLAQRQALISANVANANTPGYKAKDIESFEDIMRNSMPMTVTDPKHMAVGGAAGAPRDVNADEAEVLESGNNVRLEEEFLKSNDVARSYSMNTQIVKTFSRMLQSVTKA